MHSTDWTVVGYAETSDTGDVTHDAVRTALLPHNPRRCLVRPILLSSNNARRAGFTTGGLSSVASRSTDTTATSATKPLPPECTEFVLTGLVENNENGVLLTEMQKALLDREGLHTAVQMTSNNKRCTHFVTNGYCSAPLTNQDVLWMEAVAGCKPGTLFKRFREASSQEAPSPSELPWDPETRYNCLNANKALRTPRGAKSVEHLENLRKSDPLVNLAAWHDWSELRAQIKTSRHAWVHQQALRDRAQRAHARLSKASKKTGSTITPSGGHTASTKAAPTRRAQALQTPPRAQMHYSMLPTYASIKTATSHAPKQQSTKTSPFVQHGVHGASPGGDLKAPWAAGTSSASPTKMYGVGAHSPAAKPRRASNEGLSANGLKRAWHLDRLLSLDETMPRDESASSDTVMALLEPKSPVLNGAKSLGAPTTTVPTSPPSKWQKTLYEHEADGGESDEKTQRSPTSIMGAHPGDEPASGFPPLPQPWGQGMHAKAVDHTLNRYKVVSGPAWFSDS